GRRPIERAQATRPPAHPTPAPEGGIRGAIAQGAAHREARGLNPADLSTRGDDVAIRRDRHPLELSILCPRPRGPESADEPVGGDAAEEACVPVLMLDVDVVAREDEITVASDDDVEHICDAGDDKAVVGAEALVAEPIGEPALDDVRSAQGEDDLPVAL